MFTSVPIPTEKTRTGRSPIARDAFETISSSFVEPIVGLPSVRKTTL
ncbi:MAG: hypothetical protein IPP07_16770 [Holophagales bacterium]|nr:hypothetical protein [Holophagales bacterium]